MQAQEEFRCLVLQQWSYIAELGVAVKDGARKLLRTQVSGLPSLHHPSKKEPSWVCDSKPMNMGLPSRWPIICGMGVSNNRQ